MRPSKIYLAAAAGRSASAALFVACCATAGAAPAVSTIEAAVAGRGWHRGSYAGATVELQFDKAHRMTRTVSVADHERQTLDIFALEGKWSIHDGRIAIREEAAGGGAHGADCAIALRRPPHAFVLSDCRGDHGALDLSDAWFQAKRN